jgi:hypothetical protein
MRDSRRISFPSPPSTGNGMAEGNGALVGYFSTQSPPTLVHLSHRFKSLKTPFGKRRCPGSLAVCPLQSREEVEVAGRQVGTVRGVIQALPTEGGNMVNCCCCRVGSHIIQDTRTPVSELLAPSPHYLRRHDVRTIHLY